MNIKNRDIEALRACAILLVLASHLRYFTSDFLLKSLPQLPLWQGVDLFFVISGFLISNSLQPTASKYQQGLPWAADLKAFWIRRIFRLLPAAWLWVFIPLAMTLIWPDHPLIGTLDTVARDALAALTNTANFYWAYCIGTIHWGEFCSRAGILGVYWSLSQEEQFYLLLPLALLLLTKRRLIILLTLTILALFFVERPVFSLGWYVRPDGLLWGVLLSLCLGKVKNFTLSGFKFTTRTKRIIFVALIIALILAPSILTTFTAHLSTIGVISLISAALVTMCATGEALTPRGLAGSLLAWLGSRSYALYLSHWPIYCIIRIVIIPTNTTGQSLPLEAITFTLIWLLSCIISAEITYRYIETPLKTYGYKLATKKHYNWHLNGYQNTDA